MAAVAPDRCNGCKYFEANAYSTKLGYTSGRDAKVITYSKEFGEVSRLTISPDLVKRMTAI